MNLTLNEFSLLNAAEVDGLLKYGGSADFKLQMAKQGDAITWTVTIENPRVMELVGIFVGEKTVKLIQNLDLNKIDASEKVALNAIKSLSQKLEQALKNPIWDPVTLTGLVVPQGTNWAIQTGEGMFTVAGTNRGAVASWGGRRVIADGFVKSPGQFEVVRLIEQRTNTLELFVMSLCPFAQRAETQLLSFLEGTNATHAPALEVRYLFYKSQKEGKDQFTALHGEPEVAENLVQMVLRDRYPHVFRPYLRLRAKGGTTPFAKLAAEVGLQATEVSDIEGIIRQHRETLIRSEFAYASERYGILDGSPTYVWESQPVTDLRKVAPLKGILTTTGEACSQ